MNRWVFILSFVFFAAFSRSDEAFKKDVLPVLQKHCFACHGDKKQKGDLRLDTLDPDIVQGATGERWHDALNKINLGEMPPEEEPSMTASERRKITDWITQRLKAAADIRRNAGGQAVLRRLNRTEYQYTMTDLLGLEMNYSENLPSDASSPEGFKNNGASLGMAALQIETSLQTARRAFDSILVNGSQAKKEVTQINQTKSNIRGPLSKNFIGFSSDRLGRVNYWHGSFNNLPRKGRFSIRVKAYTDRKSGQPAPLLSAQYGYFVSGLTLNIISDAGEIPITSNSPEYYEISGISEFFPQPMANVPDDKLNGIISLRNALYDGEPPPKAVDKVVEVKNNKGKVTKKGALKHPGERAYFGADGSKYANMSAINDVEGRKIPVFIAFAELDMPMVQNQNLSLINALYKRDKLLPTVKQVLGHNHMSIVKHINTKDDSLGHDIIEFIKIR